VLFRSEEAKEILDTIPKVPEIIASLDSVDGVSSVLKRLSPAMALPAPSSISVVNGVSTSCVESHTGPTIEV
jgi:hypothetical protein